MFRVGNNATPLDAWTVSVPLSVPAAGLVPMATVMLVVALVTVLLFASCTATATVGVKAVAAVALVGWTVNVLRAGCSVRLRPACLRGAGLAFRRV